MRRTIRQGHLRTHRALDARTGLRVEDLDGFAAASDRIVHRRADRPGVRERLAEATGKPDSGSRISRCWPGWAPAGFGQHAPASPRIDARREKSTRSVRRLRQRDRARDGVPIPCPSRPVARGPSESSHRISAVESGVAERVSRNVRNDCAAGHRGCGGAHRGRAVAADDTGDPAGLDAQTNVSDPDRRMLFKPCRLCPRCTPASRVGIWMRPRGPSGRTHLLTFSDIPISMRTAYD